MDKCAEDDHGNDHDGGRCNSRICVLIQWESYHKMNEIAVSSPDQPIFTNIKDHSI